MKSSASRVKRSICSLLAVSAMLAHLSSGARGACGCEVILHILGALQAVMSICKLCSAYNPCDVSAAFCAPDCFTKRHSMTVTYLSFRSELPWRACPTPTFWCAQIYCTQSAAYIYPLPSQLHTCIHAVLYILSQPWRPCLKWSRRIGSPCRFLHHNWASCVCQLARV